MEWSAGYLAAGTEMTTSCQPCWNAISGDGNRPWRMASSSLRSAHARRDLRIPSNTCSNFIQNSINNDNNGRKTQILLSVKLWNLASWRNLWKRRYVRQLWEMEHMEHSQRASKSSWPVGAPTLALQRQPQGKNCLLRCRKHNFGPKGFWAPMEQRSRRIHQSGWVGMV